MVLLNNKFQKRPLVQNVLPLTPVYLQTEFLKRIKRGYLWCVLDILMISFSSRLIVRGIQKRFRPDLKLMSQIKRSPIFRFKNYVREKLAQISILNLLISINLYVLHNHILIIPRVLRGLGLKDQGLRLKRICAYKEDFLRHMKEMGL